MNTRIIMMMLALIVCSFSVNAQRKELRTEKNGFKWYKSFEKFFYSAESADGNTLIPISRQYKSIIFIPSNYNKGYFLVRKNNKEGVCDITGKEIIAPDKYSTVNFHEEKGHVGWYSVKNNGLMGACDITGKEIIPCDNNLLFYGPDDQFINMDRSHNMIALGVKLDNNGKMIERNIAATTSPKESSTKQTSISKTSTKKIISKTNTTSSSVAPFVSEDLKTFDLKGNVKKFTFENKTREFDRNGKALTSGNERIVYDSRGRIIEIKVGIDRLGGGHKYEYDSHGRVGMERTILSLLGSELESRSQMFYNSKGEMIKCIITDNRDNGQSIVLYSNYVYDSHGNWVSRMKNGSVMESRNIEYY